LLFNFAEDIERLSAARKFESVPESWYTKTVV
jgi:hypothetical protein